MNNKILDTIHQARQDQRDRIAKSFSNLAEVNADDNAFTKAEENDISKGKHNIGDIHPNGRWKWTQLPSGKFDWRNIKSDDAKQQPKAAVEDSDEPKEEKITIKTFEKIASESDSVKDFVSKVKLMKNVPTSVSNEFYEKYNSDGKLNINQAAESFYNKFNNKPKTKLKKIGDFSYSLTAGDSSMQHSLSNIAFNLNENIRKKSFPFLDNIGSSDQIKAIKHIISNSKPNAKDIAKNLNNSEISFDNWVGKEENDGTFKLTAKQILYEYTFIIKQKK